MKREMSDTDSEQDLLDDACSSPLHHSGMDRKKRRGIIEKRRRDRINHSLTELKRLVPAAYEKQGSAKLEKAEILQMTVDHLKVLQHQKGFGYPDPSTIAMDYRSLGFRECAGEVARYLMSVEGLDSHDPLRLRLLSHLQCFSHQRESELAKSRMVAAAVVSGGQGGNVPPPSGGQAPNTWVTATNAASTPGANAVQTGYTTTATSTPVAFVNEPMAHSTQAQQVVQSQTQFSSVPNVHPQQQAQPQHMTHSNQQIMSHPPAGCSPTYLSSQHMTPGGGSNSPVVSTSSMVHHSVTQQSSFPGMVQVANVMQYNSNGLMAHHGGTSKPYRPWGTELGAY